MQHTTPNSPTNMCRLQKQVLTILAGIPENIYLSGESAVSRFYFNHRLSNKLTFQIASDDSLNESIDMLRNRLDKIVTISEEENTSSSYSAKISTEDSSINITLISSNEIKTGNPISSSLISIDNLLNLFTNIVIHLSKGSESTDIIDLIEIAENYQFNWQQEIARINELCPVDANQLANNISNAKLSDLTAINGLNKRYIPETLEKQLQIISNDILHGNENTLCPLGAELANAIIDHRALVEEDFTCLIKEHYRI